MLANAFVAKTVLGLATAAALLERLLWPCLKTVVRFPYMEAAFSRAFAEFAQGRLAERVHEALVKAHLGERLTAGMARH